MASQKYEDKHRGDPDVQVHLSQGCDLCGRSDEHTHTQADWREHIDAVGERMKGGLAPCTRNRDCMRNNNHPGGCRRGIFRPLTSPTSAGNSASGGTAVSDIQQAKAALMAASTKLHESLGALTQGFNDVVEAQNLAMSGVEGTSQSEFEEFMGLVQIAQQKADAATMAAAMAADRAESMAARL